MIYTKIEEWDYCHIPETPSTPNQILCIFMNKTKYLPYEDQFLNFGIGYQCIDLHIPW